MLSRDQILSASDLPTEEVPVPEWGGSVFVRTLTIGERLEIAPLMGQAEDLTLRLVVLSACDESGARLFADEDGAALATKDGKALERIALAAFRLSRLGREDVEASAKN